MFVWLFLKNEIDKLYNKYAILYAFKKMKIMYFDQKRIFISLCIFRLA